MNLSDFTIKLFEKLKAWIDPKLAALDDESKALRREIEVIKASHAEVVKTHSGALTLEEVKDAIYRALETVEFDPAPPGPPGPAGPQGERGLDGKDGAPGPAGKDGANGLDGKDGAPGPAGKDGANGLDGKDALEQIEFVPEIDYGKSYPRGVYGWSNGSLYRSYAKTDGERGWDVFLSGVPSVEFELKGRQLQVTAGDQVKTFDLPMMEYRGVWKQGHEYEVGDVVSLRGSSWHNDVKGNVERPNGPDSGWTMVVRAGRDAK